METAASGNVKYEEEFILNNRGLKVFTCSWLPESGDPKAIVFLCHGYAMDSSQMTDVGSRLASAGFAAYGIDYLGHGRSYGLGGYIPSFQELVDECSRYFTSITERVEGKGKLKFLLGESMGGAVILLLHRKMPDFWDGAVLVAPMCKIAENVKPSPVVIKILSKFSNVFPTWRLIPTKDIVDEAFRDPEKRKWVRANPNYYKGRPRLKTGYELYNASLNIEQRLSEVTFPFMVLHGEADTVTDIVASEELYKMARSGDKTMKRYPGMWHSLTYGETKENIEMIMNDIVQWVWERCDRLNQVQHVQNKL